MSYSHFWEVKIETDTFFTHFVTCVLFYWQWIKTKLHGVNRKGEDIWPPESSWFELCSGLRFTWTLLSCNRTRSDRQQTPTQFTADLKTTAFSCFSTITSFIISSFFWVCCPEPWPGHLSHAPVMNEPQKRRLAGSQFFLRGEQLPEIVTVTTTPRGDPAVNSCSMGTREWKRCLCSYCCDVSLCLTSVVTDWHFLSPAFLNHLSDQSRTICVAVSEKWRFRRQKRKKDWNFQAKTILPFLFGMQIKKNWRNSSIRYWNWDIRTIFVLRKNAIHFDKNRLLESQKMGPWKCARLKINLFLIEPFPSPQWWQVQGCVPVHHSRLGPPCACSNQRRH